MSDTVFSLSFDTTTLVVIAVVGVAGIVIGWAIAWVRHQGEITGLRATVKAETDTASERLNLLEDSMQDAFAHLSTEALSRNNSMFLDLAGQVLESERSQAARNARHSEESVAALVAPLNSALKETREQIARLEADRRQAHGALGQYLKGLVHTQRELHQETRNLAGALRRPEVRGQWGELTLRRLVELAGMSEHCDFSEQPTVNTRDGALRPDMLIHLPGARQVVVDVKTPLDAYMSAVEAKDDDTRNRELDRHARLVKNRIDELSRKSYWQAFDDTLDFVVLFLPGDQFLSAALERDPDLLERALAKRVIPSTPTSVVALLRAIAFGWRQENLDGNARVIRKTGEELLERLSIVASHLDGLGRNLDTAVSQFNRLTGSFETRVVPSVRKLEGLGVASPRSAPEPGPVERRARGVQKIEVPDENRDKLSDATGTKPS